ncbi:MAG: quercetin dioxygenase-like cupin family protein [Candidatus Woesearchaeota archaeon]|jgi:quercetin dioxygenase-like cupin family protein
MTFEAKKGHVFDDPGHPQEQITIIQEGSFEFRVGEKTKIVKAGNVVYIAPNESHSATALEDVKGLDIFSPGRHEDKYN